MSFPANWTLVPVTGRFLQIDGDRMEGYVGFTPTPARMLDAEALVTVLQSEFIAVLMGDGSFAIKLPATDDPNITPTDFTYKVTEYFDGGSEYHIEVPQLYAELGIDLSTLQPVTENPGIPLTITREEFDALAMQAEILLGTVYGGSASTEFAGPGLDGGGAVGV